MSYNNIAFERGPDAIAHIVLNRPAKRNALNADTMEELGAALTECAADHNIRGLILSGAGDRAFVAGADISELAGASPLEVERNSSRGQSVFRKLETMGKPSIAAIRGLALGGGLELAMACTLRVATTGSLLGQPEVKLGLTPGYGGTQRLPRLVGRGRAMEMLLTGEPISAEEGHRIGLINHVVPVEELLEFSRVLLSKILVNAPVAVRCSMQVVDQGYESPLDTGLALETAAFALTAATEDCAEGTRAFLEKRPAKFQGR